MLSRLDSMASSVVGVLQMHSSHVFLPFPRIRDSSYGSDARRVEHFRTLLCACMSVL